MTLRTKESVEAGVVWSESCAGWAGAIGRSLDLEPEGTKALFVEYQPGNGTRYPCFFVQLALSPKAGPLIGFSPVEPAGTFLFVWHGQGAHVWRDEGFLHWTQVAEHLGCREADARVLAELIAHYTSRTAESAAQPTPATPRATCEACGGKGRIGDAIGSEPCPECNGEGTRRASTL